MIRNALIMVVSLILIFTAQEFAQPPDSTLKLDALIREALDNNPDLQAAEKRWQASLAKIPQAGALPDPVVSFNLLNAPVSTFAFDQEAMTQKQLAFTQKFPFPGKLGVRENIAEESAATMEAQYHELKNQLIKLVKINYYELYLVDKSIETVDKNTQAMEEFVKIAETKYSVGKGLQQDVLRAQVELSKMLDKRIQLDQKREVVEARLNTLLNRTTAGKFGRPGELEFSAFRKELPELQKLANEYRPLLQAWQAAIRQNQQQVRLAKKGYLPDFGLTVAYGQREELQNGMGGADFFTAKFNVQVPLYFWRKQRKKIEETQLVEKSVQQKYQQVLNQVYENLDRSLNDANNNARLVELFQTGIIPQASQSLQSAIAGYQTDKVDFLTLITNQINLFNFELDYYRVLTAYFKSIADLEAAAGTTLPGQEN